MSLRHGPDGEAVHRLTGRDEKTDLTPSGGGGGGGGGASCCVTDAGGAVDVGEHGRRAGHQHGLDRGEGGAEVDEVGLAHARERRVGEDGEVVGATRTYALAHGPGHGVVAHVANAGLRIRGDVRGHEPRQSVELPVGPGAEVGDEVLRRWEAVLTGLESDPMSLSTQLDWVAKYRLIEAARSRDSLSLLHPKVAMMDLAYHDVNHRRGLYNILQRREMVARVVTEERITRAMTNPPVTTRARLRGDFIRAAKARNRDFTVDWVHLKLNDQAQRTVLCKDPFKSRDERVERLIESL